MILLRHLEVSMAKSWSNNCIFRLIFHPRFVTVIGLYQSISTRLQQLYYTKKMRIIMTNPMNLIIAPAKSGKARYFNFPALGRALSLLLRPHFDQNKPNRSLVKEQKRREIRPIDDFAIFNRFVCKNQES